METIDFVNCFSLENEQNDLDKISNKDSHDQNSTFQSNVSIFQS